MDLINIIEENGAVLNNKKFYNKNTIMGYKINKQLFAFWKEILLRSSHNGDFMRN